MAQENLSIDLDKLATHLRSKMDSENLSLRSAATQMGVGAATLSRLLKGIENTNTPDLSNISKVTNWLGSSVSSFSYATSEKPPTIADVEVQLRALPGLDSSDVEALVAMVKASYQSAKELRAQKSSKR